MKFLLHLKFGHGRCKIKQIPSKIDASTIERNNTRDKTYLIEPKSSFADVCALIKAEDYS